MYLRWVGGKSKLVNTILGMMPLHRTYVEPFFGAGWVFWNKRPAKTEVINDIDPDLMRFYKGLTKIDDLKPIIDKHGWPYGLSEAECRRLFDKAVFILEHSKEATLEDFMWAFLYLNKFSFGGKMTRLTINPRRLRDCRVPYCYIVQLIKDFQKVKNRLNRAVIMNEDWSYTLIYDSESTLFYLDPPYYEVKFLDTELDYRARNHAPTPREIFKKLSGIKGKFILSYNDHPTIRKYVRKYDFNCTEVELKHEFRGKVVKELIITNFKGQSSLMDFIRG